MRKFNLTKLPPLVVEKNVWLLVICILLGELILAYSIPSNILSQLPLLGKFIDLLQIVAPVLGKVTQETVRNPEAVRFYIFVTLLILPIKVLIFYVWLNSDLMGVYRYLVISPLTNQKPSQGNNFINDPLRQEKKEDAENRHRSMFSRVFWSFLILLITSLAFWLVLEFYSISNSSSNYIKDSFRSLSMQGFSMWFYWSFKLLIFASFLLAVSICILRDYKIFFVKLIKKDGDLL